MDKQVGRPVEQTIDDDEIFFVATDTPAVLNDPSLARPRTGVAFSKQQERFKYEPEDMELQNQEGQEIIIAADVKELPKAKVFVNMGKQQDRFTAQKTSNMDLEDIDDNGAFRGIEMADVDKAFKANLPH